MNVTRCILSLLVLVAFFPAHASLQSELDQWLGKGQSYVNQTDPGVYRNQYGGYWTGGALSVRVPDRQVGQVFSYTPPHFSGGCSGIDSELGGFNFINKDEIIQQMRAIGQNAKMLAYNLAIKYVSSLLADTMDWVKDKADFLNQLQMDSCTAAQNVLSAGFTAVGMPTYTQINDAEDREICIERQMMLSGATRDQAQASCTRGGQRNGVLNQDKNRFIQGNLAWYVLMQSPVFRNDPQTAQWIMNLTGTILVQRTPAWGQDSSSTSSVIPGMLYDSCQARSNCLDAQGKALLDAMIGTPGTAQAHVWAWQCRDLEADEQSCADLGHAPVSVSLKDVADHNLSNVLTTELGSIMQKLSDPHSTLNDQEKALIGMSAVPLYRYVLASESFFHTQNPDAHIQQYLHMLAQQLVARNLQSLIDQVRLVFGSGHANAAQDPKVALYLKQLDHLGAALSAYEVDAQTSMQMNIQMLRDAQLYEQALISKIGSGMLQSAFFGQ